MSTDLDNIVKQIADDARTLKDSEDLDGNEVMSSYTYKECVEYEAGRVLTQKNLQISQEDLVEKVLEFVDE